MMERRLPDLAFGREPDARSDWKEGVIRAAALDSI